MDHLGRAAPKYDMNITVVGYATFSFPRGKVITRQELSVPIDGDLNEYPFDEWETAPLIVEGTFRNTSASANPAAEVVPLISITWGQLQDYKTEFPVSTNCLTTNDVNIAGQASIQAVISRTVTTKIYSIMITTMLWILSIFVIGVSLVILLQRRVAEPPVIAFTAAILFAIPNVRNAQPGVPGIGCNLDVYAYLWNVSLCALALTFNLGNFLFHQYQKGLPPKQSAPPAGVQVHVDEILVERK
ncbi:hypothetical protein BC832DRAFT_427668 [Gaertneriomyces semiglobifer]|nr:hypothetical protein BC832DRAFT_427668 [Gaertneriomyces semiglobifer]